MSDSRPDGAVLLQCVLDFFKRYVLLPDEHFYVAVALWVLHSHAITAFDNTPRLLFVSPEKESGKSRALEVLDILCRSTMLIFNTTIAAIFRLLKEQPMTLLFDEQDAVFGPKAAREHEDLRALLNAGHRRGAEVARVVGEGKKMKVEKFPVFSAVAMASIGQVPDTITSRSIRIPMRRRRPDEEVEQFRQRWATADSGNLRDSLAEWAEVYGSELADADPEMPDGVTDRAADNWAPIIAIADVIGGEWPERAREAAKAIVAGRVAEDLSLGVRLLADIKGVLNGHERITSKDLAAALNGLEESGWGGWHDGKGIGPRDLALRLADYGVAPHNLRFEAEVKKGYARSDFTDPWSRYLRLDESTPTPNMAMAAKNGATLVDELCEPCQHANTRLTNGVITCLDCQAVMPKGGWPATPMQSQAPGGQN